MRHASESSPRFGWLGEQLDDRTRRIAATILQLVSVLAILWICVRPGSGTEFTGVRWCLICGSEGVPDILLNVLLYVPLGFGTFLRTGSVRIAVMTALVLSFAVETAQLWLPARQTTPMDLVSNTLGAYLGALSCAYFREILWPRADARARVSAAATSVVAFVTLLPVFLFTPVVPPGDLYLNRAPGTGFLLQYGGIMLEARVDSMQLAQGRLPDADRIRALLEQRSEVLIRFRAGMPPLRPASLIQVTTGTQVDVLLVGIDSQTVVARPRLLGRQFRFAGPELRFEEALRDVAIADTVTVRVRTNASRDLEVQVNEAVATSGWTVARGWSLLRFRGSLDSTVLLLLDAIWLLVLFVPIGMWAPSSRALVLSAAGPVSIAVLATPFTILEPFTLVHWAVLALALLLGHGLQRLEPRSRAPATEAG